MTNSLLSQKKVQTYVLSTVAILLIVLVGILTKGRVLTLDSFQSMAFQLPVLGVLTLAQIVPMLTGGIDLSVVAVANLTGVITAILMKNQTSVFVAVLVGLSLVLLFGLLKGIFIAWFSVPPIIATLGFMILIRGISLLITKGYVIAGFPSSFLFLGNGSILGVPMPFVVFASLSVFVHVLLNWTKFGTHVYLLGSNPVATFFAGVNNRLEILKTYFLSSFLAGIAGLVMISRFNAAQADYGEAYLLLTVLACVLGGIDPAGGFGQLPGVVISIAVLQTVATGFNFLRLSSHLVSALWGIILLGVITANRLFGETRQG